MRNLSQPLILASALAATIMCGQLPPQNPFLADSPWPTSHGNPYAQASSLHEGPADTDDLFVEFAEVQGNMPTLPILHESGKYDDGSHTIWGGNFSGYIVKLHSRADGRLALIDEYYKGGGIINQSVYGVMDAQNRFIVPLGTNLVAFGDEETGNPESKIAKLAEYKVLRRNTDMLLAVSINYEGWFVYASTSGKVGIVSEDFKNHHQINLNLSRGSRLRNGIALDEEGGIYLTTKDTAFRVQADGSNLALAWECRLNMGQWHSDKRVDRWFHARCASIILAFI